MFNIRQFLWICGRCLFALALICFSTQAFAYRGQTAVEQKPPLKSPGNGFPGFFDPHTAAQGSLVFDLPTFSVDYGITDHWTLGTNLVPLTATLLTQVPIFSLKTRYQFFSNRFLASSFTLYGGYAGFDFDRAQVQMATGKDKIDGKLDSYFVLVSQNTAVSVARATSVILHLSYFNAGGYFTKNYRSQDYVGVAGWLGGLGVQSYLNDWFGLEAHLAAPFAPSVTSESISSNLHVNLSLNNNYPVLFRTLLNFKINEDSLLSLGAMGLAILPQGYAGVIPSVNYTLAFR